MVGFGATALGLKSHIVLINRLPQVFKHVMLARKKYLRLHILSSF